MLTLKLFEVIAVFFRCVQGEIELPHPRFNVDFPVVMYELNEQSMYRL